MPVTDQALKKVLDTCSATASSLCDRWQDEGAHERIQDYGQAFIPLLSSAGARYQNISGSPFAVHFTIGDEHFVLKVTRKKVYIAELKVASST